MQPRAMVNADACGPDDRRKRRHRRDGSHTECGDITNSRASCRQRERGKNTEKVRAAGDAVQNAHAERRVGMAHPARPRRSCVDVDVIVGHGAMLVRTGRNVQRATERPQPNADQRNAHHPFAPRREHID
jgi:hypothetical protein